MRGTLTVSHEVRASGTFCQNLGRDSGLGYQNTPPGANNEQPVTLEIQLVDGKFTGTMRPFLGGDDGATITEATIVGGNSAIKIAFVFRNDGLKMAGTDVQMGDVPWTTFKYDLAKKRTRY